MFSGMQMPQDIHALMALKQKLAEMNMMRQSQMPPRNLPNGMHPPGMLQQQSAGLNQPNALQALLQQHAMMARAQAPQQPMMTQRNTQPIPNPSMPRGAAMTNPSIGGMLTGY